MLVFRNRINHERTRHHSAHKIAVSNIDKMKGTKGKQQDRVVCCSLVGCINVFLIFITSLSVVHFRLPYSLFFSLLSSLSFKLDFIYKNKQPSFSCRRKQEFLITRNFVPVSTARNYSPDDLPHPFFLAD